MATRLKGRLRGVGPTTGPPASCQKRPCRRCALPQCGRVALVYDLRCVQAVQCPTGRAPRAGSGIPAASVPPGGSHEAGGHEVREPWGVGAVHWQNFRTTTTDPETATDQTWWSRPSAWAPAVAAGLEPPQQGTQPLTVLRIPYAGAATGCRAAGGAKRPAPRGHGAPAIGRPPGSRPPRNGDGSDRTG